MATALLDGIRTNYLRQGSGPPLLLMAPRGFNATIQAWDNGKFKELDTIATLSKHFTVIAYDRRESGASGGRVEPLTWSTFARQAKLLLEHLDIDRTWIMGPCMSVAVANEFAATYPEACIGLILPQPIGGHRWFQRAHAFFDRHIAYAARHGLAAVRARVTGKNFFEDPESGPWSPMISNDAAFAERFVAQDRDAYLALVATCRDNLFPDTFAVGPRPETIERIDVPASIWPGDDTSHSTSSAQQLRELMPRMEYWDIHPTQWNAANMLERILRFKRIVETEGLPPSPKLAGPAMPPLPA